MKRFRHFAYFIEAFVLYLIAIENVSPNVIGKKESESTGNLGLYNASDHVVILNATNFKSSVYGSNSSWLVEFYNSWCGHCLRYAPVWKDFSRNILAWRDVVKVSAIDCADDDNNPICREYEVMYYPMLRYFSVDLKQGSLGLVIEKGKDVSTMRHNLVKQLEIEQQEGRGSTWPNIVPYRKSELESIWKAVKSEIKYTFLIFETPNSYVGSSVILDFQNVHDMHIRRVTSDNELLCVTAKVTKFPSLILLQRDGSQKSLGIKAPTREGVRKSIQEYMSSVGINIEMMDTMEEYPEDNSKVGENDEKQESGGSENFPDKFGDVVFQLDLEKALRYSIAHEIPLSKMIDREKLVALKNYLSVLATYFPMQQTGVVYLSTLHDIIKEKRNISGADFRRLVVSTEEEMSPVYSGNLEWIGCKGSSKIYRGYPCGLWTMFHMLTVNFAVQSFKEVEYNPAKILRAMYGYITNFFGCAECARHFAEMANRSKIFEVKNEDDNILWLWRAHNEVNERLAGDATEDPQHKKIQYPGAKDCSACRDENGNWKEDAVLSYLKSKYRYEGINFYKSSIKSKEEAGGHNVTKIRKERLVSSSFMSSRKLGWDFTIFDISICVVLYVMSATILILVCIKFAVKRGYRKKPYVHSFFGRV
ncbi:sulfhydryl oxidase 1-like [Belonocnema kinseyi]|uniref:sulfhydryl oxidase 1-like n=1 Tax=Belonocnema kinseyi TaxID=2817044 RepID=UPI00143D69DB|nr:sulfhydryl oxidase 1-like [Belonocnema kinseyi]